MSQHHGRVSQQGCLGTLALASDYSYPGTIRTHCTVQHTGRCVGPATCGAMDRRRVQADRSPGAVEPRRTPNMGDAVTDTPKTLDIITPTKSGEFYPEDVQHGSDVRILLNGEPLPEVYRVE